MPALNAAISFNNYRESLWEVVNFLNGRNAELSKCGGLCMKKSNSGKLDNANDLKIFTAFLQQLHAKIIFITLNSAHSFNNWKKSLWEVVKCLIGRNIKLCRCAGHYMKNSKCENPENANDVKIIIALSATAK